jgi:hypothetical protein
MEPKTEVRDMESRFDGFMPHVDRLLLAAPNVGLTESQFDKLLSEFHETIATLRMQHKEQVAEQLMMPGMKWPYDRLPVGCKVFESKKDGERTMFIYSDPDDKKA